MSCIKLFFHFFASILSRGIHLDEIDLDERDSLFLHFQMNCSYILSRFHCVRNWHAFSSDTPWLYHLANWSRSLHQPSNDTSSLPSIIHFPSYSVFSHSMHAPILHTLPMLLPQDSVCKSWLVTDLDSSLVQALCSHFIFALLLCHQ